MYRILKMDIKQYKDIISLWKSAEGVKLYDYDDSRKSMKKFLEKNPRTCFVVLNGKEIIGTILGGNDGRRGLIYHLYIKPEHRKKGLGRELLERTEKGFKKEGIGKIYLLVLKDNAIGNKFWEQHEYKFDGGANFRSKRILGF